MAAAVVEVAGLGGSALPLRGCSGCPSLSPASGCSIALAPAPAPPWPWPWPELLLPPLAASIAGPPFPAAGGDGDGTDSTSNSLSGMASGGAAISAGLW